MVISHRAGTNHPLKSINMSNNKKKNIHVLMQNYKKLFDFYYRKDKKFVVVN